MGSVIVGMTMSLDGFIHDRNGSVHHLYSDLEALRETDVLQEYMRTTGSVVMGRRAYDMGQGDFTGYEYQVPIFVLTHHVPEEVAKGENERLTFSFITDGIEAAIEGAKAAAGDKDVNVIGGASTVQQCLTAGLVDELHVSIMPILLGDGLRLFEHLGPDPVKLERLEALEYLERTDLRFRVKK